MAKPSFITRRKLWLAILALPILAANGFAQTTTFTYQGRLTDNGAPANNSYDLQFKLFDMLTGGTQLPQPTPTTIVKTGVPVTNGIFSVQLDFGACSSCFDGSARFLEIAARLTGGPTFTTLVPRQQITSTPYSLTSQNANGLSVACVSCVTSSQIASIQGSQITGSIAGNQINGTIPVASVPAGSANYIQNSTSPQSSSDFNISGNGRADTLTGNIITAQTQYNIGINGARVLVTTGGSLSDRNTFVGISAGQANPTGLGNSFFGRAAGNSNTTGNSNSFFGADSGHTLLSGGNNSFFGSSTGISLSTGNFNTALGANANVGNNLDHATAVGADAVVNTNNTIALGRSNGSDTVLVPGALTVTGVLTATLPSGSSSYIQNTSSTQASSNFNISGTGSAAIFNASTQYSISGVPVLSASNGNTVVGQGAGIPSGPGNTILGSAADAAAGISNATAVGSEAQVNQSNSLVLGSINGLNGSAADTKVGIGTAAPDTRLNVVAADTQVHFGATTADSGGYLVSTVSSQGIIAGGARWNGASWVARSNASSQVANQSGQILFFSNTGLTAGATFTPTERMRITPTGLVGIGTTTPMALLDIDGTVRVGTLATGISTTPLCIAVGNNQLAQCQVSSIRYKEQIGDFRSGLDVVRRLRPVSFRWKEGGDPDFGFIAEEVNKVEPRLVLHNKNGEVEGVKYDHLSMVLINAVREQQAEIESLEKSLAVLQQQNKQMAKRWHAITSHHGKTARR